MGLFLYSTNCWLSFAIGQKYYKGTHFVWCSDQFDPGTASVTSGRIGPPTSSPREILNSLAREVRAGDRHSAKIASLRQGILRGAQIRHNSGEITLGAASDIQFMVEHAETRDFVPLLFVISKSRVRSRLIDVPVDKRAHPLSAEFQIERLRTGDFDVVDLFSS